MAKPNKLSPDSMLVGIGASAGGLEALKQLFSNLPADSGLAFVVVVHLDPNHPSLLADLLQPYTRMPVLQVNEDIVVEPNRVYVISPGSNLSSIDSHLRLSRIEEQRLKRAPVDHFFETLAEIHGEHCIGIILSGTGSDGSLGIRKIKEHGGLTLAQDPNEAGFDGMPQNAIATELIDLVLPVKEMPRHILRFAHTQPKLEIEEGGGELSSDNQQILQQIFGQVRARTGRDFSGYKRTTVLRRIRRRMQLHQKEYLHDYLDFLRENPNEAHFLAEEFLITVTQFFRDAETFAYLEREVIPQLFEGKSAGDSVRVWSVGCATGEEAYSLAMLLLEARGDSETPGIEVFASDLHEVSLQRARDGVYPDTIEADVSAARLQHFFSKDDSRYRVNKTLREVVVYAAHNLLRDPPFSRLDLIVCRNLLIYLQRHAQKDVFDLFHYALKPDGRLLLGPSETIDRNALFRIEDKHYCLYRRRNVPAPEPRLPVFSRQKQRLTWTREAPPYHLAEPPASYGKLHQKIVERYAPPSILVDQDFHIVHSSEHAGRYLQVPGGELSANVFKLVREELRVELRTALQAASERGIRSRSAPLPLSLDGEPKQVVIHVRPSDDPELTGLNLVIFDEMEAAEAVTTPAEKESAEVDERLNEAQNRLRSVIEQYETSQEEMRATNEELQSTNEELRSTMEELETSKEELQSMNEELQTVNQENRHKVEELSQLTSDLHNLMAATDIATLFLDRELRILRMTPQIKRLFNIRPSDRGRPVTDLHHRLGYDRLEKDARQVLDRLTPIEREIRDEHGDWYLTRLLPYRSSSDQIQGVVITLVEINQLKQAERSLRESEERYRALIAASAQTFWTTDAKGQVVEDSPSWRSFTGQTYEQWRGDGWLDAVHPEDREAVGEQWSRCLAEEKPIDLEFRLHHNSGDWRWTQMRAVPLYDEQNRVRGWVGMNSDIDDRKRAEASLRQADRRKDEFLAMLAHELRNPLAPMHTAMEYLKRQLPDEPEIQRVCDMSQRQVSHLGHLVDDLLDVARIKSDQIELKMQMLDLRDIVRSAINDIRPAIQSRHHELSVKQAAETLSVKGDEVRLTQVVTNLLDNAAKYTPQGGHISLTTRREDDQAIVEVTDNGIGLPPEMQDQVFEVFERAPRDHANRAQGLGLGLTLVQRLTQLHGGSVEAHSEGPGKGCTFRIRLTLANRRRGDHLHKPTLSTEQHPEQAPKRILIVDDNEDAANSLALMLRFAGHEIKTVHDGAQALAAAEAFSPGVVILDIGLPDMDGYALARELRKREQSATAVLIAVTGYGSREDRARSRAAGIDHHLVKPVDSTVLMQHFTQAEPSDAG